MGEPGDAALSIAVVIFDSIEDHVKFECEGR